MIATYKMSDGSG